MMYIPDSTYRIQLNREFNFDDLKKIIDYLNELGVSTIYASPITRAVSGSSHGYDVTDPAQLNPEIGTEDELVELSYLLREKGMGWLQDIVPNHMALSTENVQLMDVLERGPVSPYYDHFDINWQYAESKGKLMLFELADSKPDIKKVRLLIRDTGFYLAYDHLELPLSLPAFTILMGSLRSLTGNDQALKSLESMLMRIVRVPQPEVWRKYKLSIFRNLLDDLECNEKLQKWTDQLSKQPALMKKLLAAQYYSLHNYRDSGRMINYRRFFTVNSLICLSMEKHSVFAGYHSLLRRLYQQGLLQGLRIDHIDGLAEPVAYLRRLRRSFGNDCYILTEKILGKDEPVAGDWPMQGTTGYDFISMINQLFTRRDGYLTIQKWYNEKINRSSFVQDTVRNRMKILQQSMKGEWDNLFDRFMAGGVLPAKGKWKDVLGAWICCLPVYRTYPSAYPLRKEEIHILQKTTETAVHFFPSLKTELNNFLGILKGETGVPGEQLLPLLMRLMQFTGPLMAKGVEDTSFYTWNACIARNEVGDAPDRLSDQPVKDFHRAMIHRLHTSPLSLNTTATHDTKRGEDARIRLLTLTENADNWTKQVDRWFALNTPLIKKVNRKPAPSRNDEYFIYQTLAGAFPKDGRITKDWVRRLKQYLEKALREGKENTSWDEPDQKYEQACMDFTEGVLKNKTFLSQLKETVKYTDRHATIYSLSQLLLKLTTPGIPDIYQGCEMFDYSFVDPDNRRAVDYRTRESLLKCVQELPGDFTRQWWKQVQRKGAAKTFVIFKTLSLRRDHSLLFREGEYIPLGHENNNSVISFARRLGNKWIIVSCPLPGFSLENLSALQLPEDAPVNWMNIMTGEKLRAENLQLNTGYDNGSVQVLLLVSRQS